MVKPPERGTKMIKKIVLKNGVTDYKVFTKYVADNGKFICAINDEIITPEEGNAVYRSYKECGAVCTQHETSNESNNDIVSIIESQIDRYAVYIENYNQYAVAEEKNRKMRKLLTAFKAILVD